MKVVYGYDENLLELIEKDNGDDKEFHIKLLDQSLDWNINEVRNFFDVNKDYTDVFFYIQSDHIFRIIVKNEFYTDFLIQLFKFKILQKISWLSQ